MSRGPRPMTPPPSQDEGTSPEDWGGGPVAHLKRTHYVPGRLSWGVAKW